MLPAFAESVLGAGPAGLGVLQSAVGIGALAGALSIASLPALVRSGRSMLVATERVPVGKQPEGVLIAPDGSRAFVAVNGDNQIAVVDTKTWSVTKRISPGTGPDGMAWVP